jgi:hypothetical protein
MNVMPVASEGHGENENDDYDKADILQPSVWRTAAGSGLIASSGTIAMLGHVIHFTER